MSIKLFPQKLIFVISAPSGTGKSSIVRAVMQKVEGMAFSVSSTTRQPRPGEQDGVNYNFLTREQFQQLIAAGQFLEHAAVYGELYGTRRDLVEQILQDGKDAIMDLDVRGAQNIKLARSDAVLIYIFPPSLQEMHRRMVLRATDSPEEIEKRVKCAKAEMRHADQYDYAVVNHDFNLAVETISSIVRAERSRVSRLTIRMD